MAKGMARRQQPEYDLQCSVAEYLRTKHPSILFNSDVKGSIKLTIQQAVRWKKLQCDDFACPDLTIFEPRFDKGKAGLFMELKAETPFKKDGTLKKNEHLEEQQMAIDRLRARGYEALFVWDMGQAIQIIEEYLS